MEAAWNPVSNIRSRSRRFTRLDALWLTIWLVFLGGLAALPPELEWHKQVILLAIGIVQLLESRLIARYQRAGSRMSFC